MNLDPGSKVIFFLSAVKLQKWLSFHIANYTAELSKQLITRLDHLTKTNYSLLSTTESHLKVISPESNQDCPNDCHDSKAQVSPIFETNLNLDKFLGAMKMGGVNLGVAKAANISVTRSRSAPGLNPTNNFFQEFGSNF